MFSIVHLIPGWLNLKDLDRQIQNRSSALKILTGKLEEISRRKLENNIIIDL